MANIPGMWTLPGVYGPDGSIEILEKNGKYTIGFCPVSMWGNFIEGTVEEIARDLITKLQHDNSGIPFYGCIYVSFNPEVICTVDSNTTLRSPFAINFKFIQELTEALKPLKKLLPFI